MTTRRRFIAATSGGALLTTFGLQANAQVIERARIIVGFPPGGTPDALARQVAERLAHSYAGAVYVDNRPGAGGQLAVTATKGAPADGSTILVCAMAILGVYPYTYKKLPYDPQKDLTPVGVGVTTDYAFAVGPTVPQSITNVAAFMQWCKSDPSKAMFGSPASGSPLHFMGLMLGKASQVELTHVGYKGSQPAIQDLLGGVLPALCTPVGECLRYLPDGRLRILGTSGPDRSRFTPTVATFAEQGYKDLVSREWYGFFLPAGAPAPLVQKLNADLHKSLRSPGVSEALAIFGLEIAPGTPEELSHKLAADLERWKKIVQVIGFTAD